MSTQQSLFAVSEPAPPSTDEQCEQARRATHRVKILARLRRGPVTAAELVAITHRFSGRIFEIRKMGYQIKTEQDRASGASWYSLISEPEPQQ